MRAGIVSRTDIPRAIEITKKIIEYLESQGVEPIVETDTALALELMHNNTNLQDLDGDFIVTIGGDGTILRASMEMKTSNTPIVGINMGRRGFLSEVPPEEVEEAIQKILNADYFIEESIKVKSWSVGMKDFFPDALNEVLIASNLPSKMLLMRLSIDGEIITDIQADGAIISSPTGSTAYNMSAGGPILSGEMQAMVITPLCPHSLSFRPIVINADSTVEVFGVRVNKGTTISVDGQASLGLSVDDVVRVERHKGDFLIVNNPLRTQWDTLATKLSWAEKPKYLK